MKKFFCLTFVLLTAISVFAQERNIEKAEFDAAMKYRFVKFTRQLYRRTLTSEHISTAANRYTFFSKSVIEFDLTQQAIRTVYEFDSSSFKTRGETITIGGKSYTRKGEETWTVTALKRTENAPVNTADGIYETIETQTEYKALGKQVLNNLNANVYVKIERKKRVDKRETKNVFSTVTTKYWLDEDGAIIQEERLTEARYQSEKNSSGTLYRTLSKTVWEFDPNIRIEAPIAAK